MTHLVRFAVLTLLTAGIGCGGNSDPTPTDTGARGAVRSFADAVVRRDWPAAQALLAPDAARPAWSPTEFARRGEAYRQKFGFEPTAAHVRTLEERGDEATARLDYSGNATGRHHFKETLTLRRRDGVWGVVVPARFGQR